MTRRSWGLMLAATCALAAGLATGGALYYLAALLMYGIWALGFLTALGALLTLRVRPVTKSVRAVRGESISLRVRVGSRGLFPVAEARVRAVSRMAEPEAGEMAVVPPLLGDKEYRYVMQCPHRGLGFVAFDGVRVTDVFRLFTFSRKLKGNEVTLKIQPRERHRDALILEPGDTGVESRARATEDTASPADVRDWREGDSLKKVHWKLSMRRREVMVRTYEESMRSDTLILLDAAPRCSSRTEQLYCEDALCELALAAVRAQLMTDHPVRMPVAVKKPFELSGQNAYDYPRFAERVGMMAFDGEYGFERFVAVEMRRLLRTGAVVMVTPRLSAQLAEAALRMRRMRILVGYYWISESETEDDVALLARMRLEGVRVERINPWEDAA